MQVTIPKYLSTIQPLCVSTRIKAVWPKDSIDSSFTLIKHITNDYGLYNITEMETNTFKVTKQNLDSIIDTLWINHYVILKDLHLVSNCEEILQHIECRLHQRKLGLH